MAPLNTLRTRRKIRRHLSAQLPLRRLARALGRNEKHCPFWARRGVRIFRVDNPHTKPVAFWEYLVSGVRDKYRT